MSFLDDELDPGIEYQYYYLYCDLYSEHERLINSWKNSPIALKPKVKELIEEVEDKMLNIQKFYVGEGIKMDKKMATFQPFKFPDEFKRKDDTKQKKRNGDVITVPKINHLFPPDTNYSDITLSFEDSNSIKIVGPDYKKSHFTRDLGFTKHRDIKEFNTQGRLLFAFAATSGTLTYKKLFNTCETSDILIVQKAVSRLRKSLIDLFGIASNPIKYSKSQYKMQFNIKDWIAKPKREHILIDRNKDVENILDPSTVIENDSTDDSEKPKELNFDHHR